MFASRSLAAAALTCLAAGTAHAQLEESFETTLYVLSPSGNVYTTNVDGGPFNLVASLGLPAVSMVQHGEDLLIGAQNGSVMRFNMKTGAFAWTYFLNVEPQTMAVRNGSLYVGTPTGLLYEFDAQSGLLQEITPIGQEIEDLALDEDDLYIGVASGDIFVEHLDTTAPVEVFSYSRIGLASMGQTDKELFVGQDTGFVRVFEKETEVMAYAYPVSSDMTSIVRDADYMLIGGSDGSIHQTAQFGAVLSTTLAPEPVQALWLPQPVGKLEPLISFQQISNGVSVDFQMNAGPEHAGDYHFLLGSFAGNTPGFVVQDHQIPLNPDPYFQACLDNCLGGALQNCFGVFDANGRAAASLQIPGPLSPYLVGLELRHAYVILDAANPGQIDGISQAGDLYFL